MDLHSYEAHATGSFQNQPTTTKEASGKPTKSRKRGIAVVLTDTTNLQPAAKRACKRNTVNLISTSVDMKRPRGDPVAAANASCKARTHKVQDTQHTSSSLYQIYHHNKPLYTAVRQAVETYIARNVTMTVQKAFAVQAMNNAMSVLGMNILEAAQLVSDITRFSAYSIRLWASSLIFWSLGKY